MALKIDLVFEGIRNMLMADERLARPSSLNISGYHFGKDLWWKYSFIKYVGLRAWQGTYRWLELQRNK